MNLMLFEKFGFHGYSSDSNLDVVKEGMSDWPGNDGEMTSHSNSRLCSSKRLWDLDKVIFVNNH